MKEKINQIMDYVIGKVLDLVIAKVEAGLLDDMIENKINSMIDELNAVDLTNPV